MQTNEIGFNKLDTRKYKTITQAVKLIIKEEGILALWKGNLPATIMYFVYGGVQFLSYYELTKSLQATSIPVSMHAFIGGAGAGVFATFIGYPLDLLRTRFAVQGNDNKLYKGLFSAIVDIKRKEGINGFYKGLLPSLLSIMPQMGLVFHFHTTYTGLYSKYFKRFNLVYLDASKDLLTGGLAGITSKLLVLPLDVVRFKN